LHNTADRPTNQPTHQSTNPPTQGYPAPTPAQQAALAAANAEHQAQSAASEEAWSTCGPAGSGVGGMLPRLVSALCGACGKAGCSPSCSDALRFMAAPPHAHCTPRGPTFFFGCSFGFSPLLGPRPKMGGSPDEDGEDEADCGGGAAAERREYYRQLGGMLTWQAGMWFFGLLVVVMMVAAGTRDPILTVADYVEVGRFSLLSQVVGWPLTFKRSVRCTSQPLLAAAPNHSLQHQQYQTNTTVLHSSFTQVVWAARSAPICYTMMVVGYGLYLFVGFNAAMGSPVGMRQVGFVSCRCTQIPLLQGANHPGAPFQARTKHQSPLQPQTRPQVVIGLATGLACSCLFLATLVAFVPGAIDYAPAGAVTLAGGIYLCCTMAAEIGAALAALLSPGTWLRGRRQQGSRCVFAVGFWN
jgi:hypothetical protein